MKLLTAELRQKLPRLGAQDGAADPMVYAKFFTPDSGWTFLVMEGEEEECLDDPRADFRFFGFVMGYFLLSELEQARGPWGLPIERDLHFKAAPLSQVLRADHRLEPERCHGCGRVMVARSATWRLDGDRKPVCAACVSGRRWREWTSRKTGEGAR